MLYWLCCFIGGTLLFLNDVSLFLIAGSVILIVLGIVFRIPSYLNTYIVFSSLFILLGYLSIETVFPKKNDFLTVGPNYYIGTVVQQLNTGKTWSTNLVRLDAGKNKANKWKKTNEKVLLLTENGTTVINQNDVILFQTDFKEISIPNNPGEFNAQMYWQSKGVRYQGFGTSDQIKLMKAVPLGWFDNLLEISRNYSSKILDKWVGKNDAPLIKAILLGDKSDLDTETKRIFTNTGAMHMLAVSGMHIGLIVVLLAGIFKLIFFHRARIFALWIMIVLLWFYAFLTGFSASVTRAVVMFTILIFAQLMRRGYHPINSLSIAAFFILLWDPMAIFDIGFQLSFLAMAGIFAVYPMLENVIVFKQKWLNNTWQGTAIGLASQVFTVPVSVYYFSQFPNYFILTNFGVMLFSGVMLGLAIALLAVGKIALLSLPVGWFLALSSTLLVSFIAFVEMIPGALSVGFTPSLWWVLVAYLFVFLALIWIESKKWIPIFIVLIGLISWLQIDRTKNLYKQEWIVFNSNTPTLLFNNGKNQICFYLSNEKSLSQAKRLVEDYQKIHPGNVAFIPFSKNIFSFKISNSNCQVSFQKEWYEIKINNHHFALITSDELNLTTFDPKFQLLSMRGNTDDDCIRLKDGAFRFTIK